MAHALLTLTAATAHADEDVVFNDAFLSSASGKPVDVSRFARGNPVTPGSYRADVYVNNVGVGRLDISFVSESGTRNDDAIPCLNASMLQTLGVDGSRLAPASLQVLAANTPAHCSAIGKAIPQASSTFDMGEQRLDISIPQLLMRRVARGYVSPELWDRGVNAGFLGYSLNTFRVQNEDQSTLQSDFASLNAGINLGDWHLRHNGSATHSSSESLHYDALVTYAQRDLPALSSQLIVGDTFTSGEFFDSIPLRGVQLASDDRMVPESQRGYAPVIRGMANSNARVAIQQNGSLIYETTVAAGPFEINDLYATGYGGSLDVIVTEANGQQFRYSVPYAALPQLVRAGTNRFNLTAGFLRDNGIGRPAGVNSPSQGLLQGTWQHGLNNTVTLYAGGVVAQGYYAALEGAALNTAAGAFAADMTVAQTIVPYGSTYNGDSLRLSYSKRVVETGTQFAMAAYRYSSGGYFGVRDAMLARAYGDSGLDTDHISRQRSRLQVNVNQSLGATAGQVYLSGSSMEYWENGGRQTQYQMGYSNHYRALNYTLTAQRQYNTVDNTPNTSYQLSLTLPLGRGSHTPTFSSTLMRDSDGNSLFQNMVSGNLGDENRFNYGVQAGGNSSSTQAGVNVGYNAPYATLMAGYSRSQLYQQYSAGISGGIVVHPGGVTLSPPLGDTFAVISAPGAAGAGVSGGVGLKLDGRGYAVVPYLSPYMLNSIDLDPKGTPDDVRLETSEQRVAPHAGAILLVSFETSRGRNALIHAPLSNGEALPLGASVTDEQGRNVGLVGQASRLFVQTTSDAGILSVRWGNAQDQHCRIAFDLPEKSATQNGMPARIESRCQLESPKIVQLTHNP